jgi:phosphomannomutase
LSGTGARVLRLAGAVPTPLLAFAVLRLGCTAGVTVTASHNPPDENGLKVYLADGMQIVSPIDAEIAAAMDAAWPASEIPLGNAGEPVAQDLVDEYAQALAALSACRPARPPGGALRVLYTPLHGVGGETLVRAFARAGRERPEVLASQAEPDPGFPSAPRPNPEERAALAPLLARAAEGDFDLLLANDPDADRLAVAVPSGRAPGGWRILSGDEIAVLLAEHVITRSSPAELAEGVLVSTVASATLLAELAARAGVAHAQTLPGFKWVMRAGAAMEQPRRLLFGYEEALGFFVGEAARDKDGIGAALAMAACAEEARAEGSTLEERLERLALRFGLHATRLVSVELAAGAPRRAARCIMGALRSAPPEQLAGEPLELWQDLLEDATVPPGAPRADRERIPGLPRADVLVLGTREGSRVVVRPSGSEPRVKLYLQARVAVARGNLADGRDQASARLDGLESDIRRLLAAAPRG